MRMNQDERRFDFHGLGLALKRAREEKGWTQAYVAELVDRDSRTIMNIENKGQYPSFDLFVKLITMFDVSVDQFIHADGGAQHRDGTGHRLFLKAVVGESAFAEPDHVLDLIQDRRGSVRMDADEQQADRVAAEIDDADGFFRPL